MHNYAATGLIHDPLHGYIPFTNSVGLPDGEASERELIDHPWVQRLRQIHQLQTAWWVFPSAEHTRFQHVLGVMHLASRVVESLYDSLRQHCPDVPSRGYVDCLMRISGLLHDVGHGPFGHFLDHHLLADYHLTHETLGQRIIEHELGELISNIRRSPNGAVEPNEQLDPRHVSHLIVRPKGHTGDQPRWLNFLRSLFCGIYTVDNMDFVLRDAYMSGFNARAFDLDRLIYYSFYSDSGLTIHDRGLPALVRFISVRAELFRSLYYHRTVRALDLTLADLFAESKSYLFEGNPAERLDAYQQFTEWSLLVDVAKWHQSDDAEKRRLGVEWQKLLRRQLRWHMAVERTIFFDPARTEQSSIFGNERFVEDALRKQLPASLADMPLRVDLPRHVHRPGTQGPASGQNFLFDSARNRIGQLTDHELFRRIPLSYRLCRVYAERGADHQALASALDQLVGPAAADDLTNM